MTLTDARLVVWNPSTGNEVGSIELRVKPVISGDEPHTQVLVGLDPVEGSPFIREEWLGMDYTIEVSPKAVTSDRLTSEIVDLARRMGVQVG